MVPAMKTAIDIAGPTDLNIPFSLNCNSVVILTMHMDFFLWSEIKITLLTYLLYLGFMIYRLHGSAVGIIFIKC